LTFFSYHHSFLSCAPQLYPLQVTRTANSASKAMQSVSGLMATFLKKSAPWRVAEADHSHTRAQSPQRHLHLAQL